MVLCNLFCFVCEIVMALSEEEHLNDLIRHIELVRSAGILLGKRLIKQNKTELGRALIARVFTHDASKFFGIEWDYLHAGKDIPKAKLTDAIRHHTLTNDHHPEYYGGIEHMPMVACAEMICDWYARSQEFGTSLRDWIDDTAMKKYKIKKNSQVHTNINYFVNLLLENSFS